MANTEGFFERFHPLYGSYRKDRPASVEVADQALAFTPVGTADAVSEIVEEGRQDDPNYLQMGLMGLAEVLGYAPMLGGPLKAMARKGLGGAGSPKKSFRDTLPVERLVDYDNTVRDTKNAMLNLQTVVIFLDAL